MRRTLRNLSEADLIDLADEWGVDVKQSEVENLCNRVNNRLKDLDEVYDMCISRTENGGERFWEEPTVEEDPYNAIVTLCDVRSTEEGILSGTRVGLKDNIALAGVPMQCGSAVMEGFVPSEDATVVSRLLNSGAQITGKTNLDEFAGGGRGISVDGTIHHPMDETRYPGGSSGGSAAAVLANQVDIALGTDTGGSVRVPAAVCGLFGIKPTYGIIPLSGIIENTYSLDHVGIISETAAEGATVLDAISGKDEKDPASMAAAGIDGYSVGGYATAVEDPGSLENLTFARLAEGFQGCEPAVADTVDATLDSFVDAGATVRDVSLPEFDLVGAIKNCLTCPELAQYWRDGGVPLRRGGGGESRDQVGFARRAESANGELNPFYRGRILTGASLLTDADGRHYSRALAARRELRSSVRELLESAGADTLVFPTSPGVAPLHEDNEDPGFVITRNTRIANITGQPGISVPSGTVEGLPVGLHLLGPRFSERLLLRAAAVLERKI